MKKIFFTLFFTLFLLTTPFIANGQLTVPQGGTGTTTFPSNWVLLGNSTLRLKAVATTSLGLPTFADIGAGFSTTSADYWKSVSNFYSTTSADYFTNSSSTIPHAGNASFGQLLGWDGSLWEKFSTSSLNILLSDTLGTLSVSRGGTGATSLTGILQGNGTSPFTVISDSSTVGQVLRVTGASTYAWGALDLTDGDAITGALGASNGGTGLTSLGAGIATWLGTPTAANLRLAVSGTTGTAGNLVFSTSPTITTPTIADFTSSTHNHQGAAGGGQLDHGLALTGLTDDDHTQYALLAGRSGGQTLIGGTASGNDLTLQSTSNATKGQVDVGQGTIAKITVDEANNAINIGGGGIVAHHAVRIEPSLNSDVSNMRGIALVPIVESNTTSMGGFSFSPAIRPGSNMSVAFGVISTSLFQRANDDATSYNVTDFYNYFNRIDLGSNYSGTLTNAYNFRISNPTNAGSGAITNLFGLYIDDLTIGATTNRGIQSAVSSGAGKHNLYISGTADNYLAGNTGVGVSSPNTILHAKPTSGASIIQSETSGAAAALVANRTDGVWGRLQSGTRANFYFENAGTFAITEAASGDTATDASFGTDVATHIEVQSGGNVLIGANTGGTTGASSGKLAVGTSSLTAKLSVHGVHSDALQNLFVVATSTLTSTTTAFVIDRAGNVGLGESVPASALEVNSSSGTTTIQALSTTASVGSRIILEDTDGAGCTEITALNGVLTAKIVTCL